MTHIPQKYAVIDLGTNTFHILIVESLEGRVIRQIHKERIYVKLAEDGIGEIGSKAFARGVDALKAFKKILDAENVKEIRAFGTAALRTASNGVDFVKTVKEEIGLDVEIISGIEEARLIHEGVMVAIPAQEERILIMDIGGGSVEFIIADNEKVYWSESFPIGVAVLFNEFHHSDPITDSELNNIFSFLNKKLQTFLEAMDKYQAKILVGASGTFDVLEIMMEPKLKTLTSTELDLSTFVPLYSSLVGTTYKERLRIEEIPNTRADMIIVALVLIQFVLGKTKINDIIVSSYAMKEGILKEMMKEIDKN